MNASGDPIIDGLCEKLRLEGGDDPALCGVITKLIERSKAGQKKYGTTLARADLSRKDWMHHAQQEAMDLANYLEALMNRGDALTVFQGMQEAALAIATELEAELSKSPPLPVSKSTP